MPQVSEREEQIREAYRIIADKAGLRPDTPKNSARQWCADEDENEMWFEIGCTNFATAKQTVYAIEAARCLCAGNDLVPLRLLRMAVHDLERMHPEYR